MPASARLGAVLTLVLCASASLAAEQPKRKAPLKAGEGVTIEVRDGDAIQGLFLRKEDGAIWVGVDQGELAVELGRVKAIRRGSNRETEYRRRKAALKPGDGEGLWAVAKWAESVDLHASARADAEAVIVLLPNHKEAHAMLGHENHAGQWLSEEQNMDRQGMVEYRGQWITKKEMFMIESIKEKQGDVARGRRQ